MHHGHGHGHGCGHQKPHPRGRGLHRRNSPYLQGDDVFNNYYGRNGRDYYAGYTGKNRFGFDAERFKKLEERLAAAQAQLKKVRQDKAKDEAAKAAAQAQLLRKAQQNRMKLQEQKNKVKGDEAIQALKKTGRLEEFKKLVEQFGFQKDEAKKAQVAIVVVKSKDEDEARKNLNAALKDVFATIL